MLYGTAWKEDRTETLTSAALAAGFTAFDTANQRKHYCEEGVGRALAAALAAGRRDELFLQTKFTYQRGQDHRLPYDPRAKIDEQVRQSFQSSLAHLGVERLDSYLLHGPETGAGLTPNDWLVWRAMEELHDAGKVGAIGASNMSAAQLEQLHRGARVKPRYLQNRCYPSIAWDRAARTSCLKLGVVYQGFNLIRDQLVWRSPHVAEIAQRLGATTAQVIYRWAMAVKMLPLTGTTDAAHQAEALKAAEFELTPAEIAVIEELH
jgi:diketogulonate reductase-like aldo/keto reductase